MSTAQVPIDVEYAYSSPKTPQQYNLGLGASGSSSSYPNRHHDAYMAGLHFASQSSHLPADLSYAFLAEQEHFAMQYHLAGLAAPFTDNTPSYLSTAQPMLTRGSDATTSDWTGAGAYGGYYNSGTSAAFLQTLQCVIDSSHTAQVQQQNAANAAASGQASANPTWSLSGSLDPTTGVFQRSTDHPRLRTAQACEKCRKRKAKCSGEQPCKRCFGRDLDCEYASERKMRGPNKNRRKGAVLPNNAEYSLPSSTPKPTSSSLSSDSESTASERQPSQPSPGTLSVDLPEPSSTHSSPAPAHRKFPAVIEARRPRSVTVGAGQSPFGASSHMSGMTRASLPKPRPPPLDLTDARETYPRLLEQYVGYTEQAPSLADDRINKRTSLPAYLVESYSRIALHNLDESLGAPIPFESRSISQEIMSNYLHDPPIDEVSSSFTHATANTGSNSPDMSAPITPISLVDATAGLMDSEATSTLHSGFGGFEQGHDWAAAAVQNQWMDGETPRGSKQGLMIELGDVVDLAP